MKLEYYSCREGNFGDDLNPWLWPKLFPGLFDQADGRHFIGIGSVLDGRYTSVMGQKLVFGSGVRSPITAPRLDHTWTIRFVRGPLSARALGLDPSIGLCDSALALAFTELPNAPRDRIGLMPHFRTAQAGPWRLIAELAGMRLIDPSWEVPRVLASLAQCDRLITEAMHGAIVADLLRVPWMRVACLSHKIETTEVSEFKWSDWGASVEVATHAYYLPTIGRGRASLYRRAITRSLNIFRAAPIIVALRRLAGCRDYRLSIPGVLATRIDRLGEEIARFQQHYC